MKKQTAGDIERMSRIKRGIVLWVWFVSITTVITLFIYVVAQQNLRMDANNPQIQIAEDDAAAISSGTNPQLTAPSGMVNMAQSLAPFIIFFDMNGIPTASSGELAGITPAVPQGVFQSVRDNGEDRFTWEPQDGVRIATVVTKIGSGPNGTGFVLAGRSLRDVEDRESQLGLISFVTYLSLLVLETGLLAITVMAF